jgi:hypothetical protein
MDSTSFLKNWADPINDIIYSNVFASDILFDAKVLLITDYALRFIGSFAPQHQFEQKKNYRETSIIEK